MRHWISLPLPLDVLFEDFLNESTDEPLLLVSVVEAWSQIESVRNNQLGQTVAPEADAEPSPGGVSAPLRKSVANFGERRDAHIDPRNFRGVADALPHLPEGRPFLVISNLGRWESAIHCPNDISNGLIAVCGPRKRKFLAPHLHRVQKLARIIQVLRMGGPDLLATDDPEKSGLFRVVV